MRLSNGTRSSEAWSSWAIAVVLLGLVGDSTVPDSVRFACALGAALVASAYTLSRALVKAGASNRLWSRFAPIERRESISSGDDLVRSPNSER